MRIDDYQTGAAVTAIYQDTLIYPTLGLAGECGELVGKMIDGSSAKEAAKEIGDCIWYLAAVATDAELELVKCVNGVNPDSEYFDSFDGIRPPDAFFPNENLSTYVGIVCECVKKTLRDDGGKLSHDRKNKIANSLGQILILLGDFALECETTLDEVAQVNLDKLASRAARGTITGDGDNR